MVVALLAIAVMVGATQVHLARVRLANLADELAVAALADALQVAYVEAQLSGGTIRLDDAALAGSVAERLAQHDPRAWVDDVDVIAVASQDDATVQVVLSRSVAPFVGSAEWLPGGTVTLTATGSARAS
nr:hypothetical protein [Demequina sp. NBRC 110053]